MRQVLRFQPRLVAVVLLVLALLVPVASPAARAVLTGTKVPAIGLNPHYAKVGNAETDAAVFSCQVTTPAGCYSPNAIRAAYGVDQLNLDGAGQTIMIVDAYQSPTIQHDLDTFNSLFDLPTAPLNIIAPQGLTPFDQSDANQVGWAGEITLDVEYAHAIAPAATIDLVLAKSNEDADIYQAVKYAIRNNLGTVLSQSYGEAEQCEATKIRNDTHKLFVSAAKKGITVLASAGDQGAAQPTCDNTSFFKAASTPASDPLVTGVGGTTLDADGVSGAYHGEKTWNEPSFASAGGGGTSIYYAKPDYQSGVAGTARTVPDVAYNAAIIGGVLAVWSTSGQGSDLVFRFGGTSAGSPQWAGLIALASQQRGAHIGLINPTLYATQASTNGYLATFHDILAGNNTYHGADVRVPGYSATHGYDLATGLGSPKAQAVVPLLAADGPR